MLISAVCSPGCRAHPHPVSTSYNKNTVVLERNHWRRVRLATFLPKVYIYINSVGVLCHIIIRVNWLICFDSLFLSRPVHSSPTRLCPRPPAKSVACKATRQKSVNSYKRRVFPPIKKRHQKSQMRKMRDVEWEKNKAKTHCFLFIRTACPPFYHCSCRRIVQVFSDNRNDSCVMQADQTFPL